jgi:putative SOS response-associated peptidase YedK
MCFTIEVHLTRKAIENRFSVDASSLIDFDFNYFYRAFQNPLIPVITQDEPERVQLMQWGLIPSWVPDREKAGQIRKGTYNARAESLQEKPSFRGALKGGRCCVISHGFFEWQHVGNRKIPWYIRLKNDAPFLFAGLCSRWVDRESGEIVPTFTIITTRANPLLEQIHNSKKRMPVILPPDTEMQWIRDEFGKQQEDQLMVPFPEDQLHAHTVSNKITIPGTDPADPGIIEESGVAGEGSLF